MDVNSVVTLSQVEPLPPLNTYSTEQIFGEGAEQPQAASAVYTPPVSFQELYGEEPAAAVPELMNPFMTPEEVERQRALILGEGDIKLER